MASMIPKGAELPMIVHDASKDTQEQRDAEAALEAVFAQMLRELQAHPDYRTDMTAEELMPLIHEIALTDVAFNTCPACGGDGSAHCTTCLGKGVIEEEIELVTLDDIKREDENAV